jgi:hypothetical protein
MQYIVLLKDIQYDCENARLLPDSLEYQVEADNENVAFLIACENAEDDTGFTVAQAECDTWEV